MPLRQLSGTYLNLQRMPNWERGKNKVVTITHDLRKTFQTGAVRVLRDARTDGTVIAPFNLAHGQFPYDLFEIGQLYMAESEAFDAQTVGVHVTDTKPALVLLDNEKYLSRTLYGTDAQGKVVDPPETILRRIAFFNRAVILLLREADIDPRILHLVDWPTALSLLYLEEENLPVPQTLFTFPDARFQGLFDQSLLPILGLTGQRPTDLRYHDKISLAQIGMLRATRVATMLRGHIHEVIKDQRTNGDGYGDFRRLFEQRYDQRELYFLYNEASFAERVAGIDMLAPRPGELDFIFGALLRFMDMYDQIESQADLRRMSDRALYNAAESRDLSPFVSYAKILEALEKRGKRRIIPAFKALVKGFGSEVAVNILRSGNEQQKENFLRSLQELSIDWYNYDRIVRGALFDAPRQFERLSAVETSPVLEATDETKRAGLAALKGSDGQVHSDLMVVTMSGGLGQRLRFAIQISSDVLVRQSELSEAEISQLRKLENDKKVNLGFLGLDGEVVWRVPDSLAGELEFLERFDPTTERTVKLPSQILGQRENELLAEAKISRGIDGKQDATWFISVDQFSQLASQLSAESDIFVTALLEQISQTTAHGQGTLFVNIPKGIYKLPGSELSLFEMQARALARLGKQVDRKFVWGVMLSCDNEQAVQQYFEANLRDGKYFGVLDRDQVLFESQGNNPIVVITNKKKQETDIVIGQNGEIVAAANGHGGFHDVFNRMLKSLEKSLGHQPKHVLGCNIENVLFNLQLGNIDFITGWLGAHVQGKYDVTGLASEKARPTEKMGIFARADRVDQVIEYNHPSFTAVEAFAYLTPEGRRFYFVKDPQDNILLVPPEGLARVFAEAAPPGKGNFSEEMKHLREGYELLEMQQVPEDAEIHTVDARLRFSGQACYLEDLGEIVLEYRQGNTNIFILSKDIIIRVVGNPTIMSRAEHKQGSHRRGIKVEGSIFDVLARVRDFEALPSIDLIKVAFVKEAREECFEPVKSPADVARAQEAGAALIRRLPELDLK